MTQGSDDFEALARQYWGMWGDALRGLAPQAGGVWAEAGVLRDEAGPILDLSEASALPGSHSAQYPLMRFQRMSTSWIVSSSAWPRWSWPVTFGGGITMVNGFLSGSRSAWNQPPSVQ